MDTIEKKELMSIPVWTLNQMMRYLGIKSRTTGEKVKKRAFEEFNGKTNYGTQYVRRDAILAMLDTSAERELEILENERD